MKENMIPAKFSILNDVFSSRVVTLDLEQPVKDGLSKIVFLYFVFLNECFQAGAAWQRSGNDLVPLFA
jgi:hypothetical protein